MIGEKSLRKSLTMVVNIKFARRIQIVQKNTLKSIKGVPNPFSQGIKKVYRL